MAFLENLNFIESKAKITTSDPIFPQEIDNVIYGCPLTNKGQPLHWKVKFPTSYAEGTRQLTKSSLWDRILSTTLKFMFSEKATQILSYLPLTSDVT